MNKNLSEAKLDQFIKENLEVEQQVALSVTLNGKKYSETVSAESLLKVYEQAVKGEQIFSTKVPEMFENLKQKILKDLKSKSIKPKKENNL